MRSPALVFPSPRPPAELDCAGERARAARGPADRIAEAAAGHRDPPQHRGAGGGHRRELPSASRRAWSTWSAPASTMPGSAAGSSGPPASRAPCLRRRRHSRAAPRRADLAGARGVDRRARERSGPAQPADHAVLPRPLGGPREAPRRAARQLVHVRHLGLAHGGALHPRRGGARGVPRGPRRLDAPRPRDRAGEPDARPGERGRGDPQGRRPRHRPPDRPRGRRAGHGRERRRLQRAGAGLRARSPRSTRTRTAPRCGGSAEP